MREKLNAFMRGRNGVDALSRFCILTGLILSLAASFAFARVHVAYSILDGIGLATILLGYFRIFSKDLSRRAEENAWFLRKTGMVRRWFGKQKYFREQKKIYHIYSCPGCGQKIRAPKGKGRIEISCPKCGKAFIKKS